MITVVGSGGFVLAPGGTPPTFRNASASEAASFFGLISSSEGLECVRDLAAAFPTQGPPDLATVREVYERYGVTIV